MALTLTSPSIHSDVYFEGIKNKITTNTKMAIALTDINGAVLATSAVINAKTQTTGGTKESEATDLGLSGQISYTASSKTLKIPTIEYTSTKDLIEEGNSANASNFVLYDLTGIETGIKAGEAFEKSGKWFNFPSLETFNTAIPLVVGNLNGSPVVNNNSNFRLTETSIVFSEVEA